MAKQRDDGGNAAVLDAPAKQVGVGGNPTVRIPRVGDVVHYCQYGKEPVPSPAVVMNAREPEPGKGQHGLMLDLNIMGPGYLSFMPACPWSPELKQGFWSYRQ